MPPLLIYSLQHTEVKLMVDLSLMNSMYQDLVNEHNMLVDLVQEKETIIQELLRELDELKQETHRTKEGAIVKLHDMTNLHILRYLRIKFEHGYNDRTRFIQELLDRGFEHYGSVTEDDAKELGFCSTGITWAKERFYVENGKVSPRALLLYIAHVETDLTYCVQIVDALIHFCYKYKITNKGYED